MPIGTGIVYNTGDLILSQVSSSGTAFLETKIAAATSSLIYFDSTARINSASLNSITVGTASYVSGSNSIITNLTASNISASRTGSFGAVAIGTNNLQDSLTIGSSISESLLIQNNTYNNLSNGIQITSNLGFLNGASTNLNFARWTGTDVTDHATIGQSFNVSSWDLQFSSGRQNTGSAINYFTSSAVRMTIKAVTGNVGIGTTNPSGKLEIRTDAASTYIFSGSSSSGYTARFLIDDTALYIGHDSSVRSFTLRTNSTDRMTIAGGGNVGIGTISPAQSLDVSGSIRIRSAGTYSDPTDNAGFLNYDSIGGIFTISARSNSGNTFMAFRTSNGGSAGERMRIDNNGYVAINTTNTTPYSSLFPGQLVIDAGTGNVDGIFSSTNNINAAELILTKKNPTNNFGSLLIQHSGSAGDAIAVNYSVNTSTGGGGTNSFKVTTDGTGYFRSNVGIGTNSPLTRLHISNVSVNPVAGAIGGDSKLVISGVDGTIDLLSQDDNSTVSNVIGMGRYNSSTGALIHKFGIVTWANTGAAGSNTGDRFGFHYGTNADSYASTELLTIKSGGNVGIGSTNPSYKLDVVGPSTALSSQPGIVGRFTQDVDGRTLIRVVNSSISSGAAALQSGISFVTYSTSSNQPSTNTHEAQIILGSTGATSVSGGQTGTLQIVAPLDIAFNVSASNTIMTGSSYTTFGSNAMYLARSGNVGIGTTNPVAKLQVSGSVSGSSFTSSISNAVGFLGTSSWAQNVVSASYATTAQTANALNTGNSYTIAGLTNNGTLSQQGTLSMGSGYQILATTGTAPIPGIAFVGDTNTGIYSPSADTIGFSISGSEKIRIDSNGNVGIGTTTVGNKLTVTTSTQYDGYYLRNVNGVVGTMLGVSATNDDGTVGLYSSTVLKTNITANGVSYFNGGNVGIGTTVPAELLDIAASTDSAGVAGPKVNFKKGSTNKAVIGIGGNYLGQATNTDDLIFRNDAGNILFGFSGAEKMRIASGGNVGIGTTGPSYKLDVSGSAIRSFTSAGTAEPGFIVDYPSSNGYGAFFVHVNGTRRWRIGSVGDLNAEPALNFHQEGTGSRMIIGSNGFVGIGTSVPAGNLDIYSTDNATEYVRSSTSAIRFLAYNDGTNWIQSGTSTSNSSADLIFSSMNGVNQWIRIQGSTGNIGIGTVTPTAKLEISGSGNSALLNIKSPISGAILYVSGSGAVGINTNTVGAFTLQVNGSFGATTKSFIIDHPTKEGKKLMYGSLESPYHGIRLTGRDTLVNGKCKVELPDYMYKLILHDSINIQLTGIKCNKTLYIDDINIPENYFTIAYDKAIFESYKDYDFFWDFTAIRADVPELQTEM